MANEKEDLKKIDTYLFNYLSGKRKDYLKDKILEKLAKKLGFESFYNLISGNFPAAKLASFATSYLKMFWYEGYYIANGCQQINPYDPANDDQIDSYSDYLLYSWARYLADKAQVPNMSGGPGYKYFDIKAAVKH